MYNPVHKRTLYGAVRSRLRVLPFQKPKKPSCLNISHATELALAVFCGHAGSVSSGRRHAVWRGQGLCPAKYNECVRGRPPEGSELDPP